MKNYYEEYMKRNQNITIPVFPFSNDDIRNIIETRSLASKQYSTNFSNLQKVIIMISIISSIILLGIFGLNYLSMEQKPTKVIPLTVSVKPLETKNEEKNNIQLSQLVEKNQVDKNSSKIMQENISEKILVTQNTIELTDDELEKFGIQHDSNSYSLVTQDELVLNEKKYLELERKSLEMDKLDKDHFDFLTRNLRRTLFTLKKTVLEPNGYDTTLSKILYREKFVVNNQKCDMLKIKYNGWDHDKPLMIAPVAINVNNFKHDTVSRNPKLSKLNYSLLATYNPSPLFNLLDSSFKFLPKEFDSTFLSNKYSKYLDRFVTIQFVIPPDERLEKKFQKTTIIRLVYIPTSEFIDALPERYKSNLIKELALLCRIENNEISVSEACNAITGENTYIDICHSNSDIIKEVLVSPNPVSNNVAMLSFSLFKQNKLNIDLYSFKSGFIKEIKKETTFEEGPNKIQLNLDNCENGIYMISITDLSGNQVIKKFIIYK